MADDFWTNANDEIITDGSDQPLDCPGCPCTSHSSLCEAGRVADVISASLTFQTLGGGNAFVDFDLMWSATAVGGVSEGWRYASGDLELCDGYLYLREMVFACNAGVWTASWAIVQGGVQVDLHTGGGNMSDFALVQASGPRLWESQTTFTDEFCPDIFPGQQGNLIFDVATLP